MGRHIGLQTLEGLDKASRQLRTISCRPVPAPATRQHVGVLVFSTSSFHQPKMQNPCEQPLSSSFLGLPYRSLNINHKKELLRGIWVQPEFRRSLAARHTPGSCPGRIALFWIGTEVQQQSAERKIWELGQKMGKICAAAHIHA